MTPSLLLLTRVENLRRLLDAGSLPCATVITPDGDTFTIKPASGGASWIDEDDNIRCDTQTIFYLQSMRRHSYSDAILGRYIGEIDRAAAFRSAAKMGGNRK
jgi:hypothetical protein